MYFGFPFGVPFGDHTWIITWAECVLIDENNSEYRVSWIVADECDGFYSVAVDGFKVKSPLYCVAGQVAQVILNLPTDRARLVSICPQGQFGDELVRVQDQIEALYEDGLHFPSRFKAVVRSKPSALIAGSSQLTVSAQGGLQRGVNVARVAARPTWGVLDLVLTTDTGVHTLTANLNGQPMLTGSRTGDGTIIIQGAGASIEFALTYTEDFITGVQIIFRWPLRFYLYLNDVAFPAGYFDVARTPNAIIFDDGNSNVFARQFTGLSSGNKYLLVHALGDDLSESTSIGDGGTLVTVYGVPPPVTDLHYVSGGGAATIIGWTAQASGAVPVNVYDSGVTGTLLIATPAGTVAAGVTSLTLPTDIGTFTGKRYIVARSVDGGIEEPSLNLLTIEYESGVVIPLRPCMAAAGNDFYTNGLNITVPVSVFINREMSYPDTVALYFYQVGDNPDYGTPTASVPMPLNPNNTPALMIDTPVLNESDEYVFNENGDQIYFRGILASVEVSGLYYFRVGTLKGTTQTNNPTIFGPVMLTTVAQDDPLFSVFNS